MSAVRIAIETGKTRVFAVALDWPGWARSARDEEGAIEALDAYATRYKKAVGAAARGLTLKSLEFTVAERLRGNASTDFGVPEAESASDLEPPSAQEFRSLLRVLRAAWSAFDTAAERAEGTPLRTGPRGGGRDLVRMRAHLSEADHGYLGRLGAKYAATGDASVDTRALREAFVEALGARLRGEIPDRGPRGGARWSVRAAIRRSAWHALDHAWEIEDRLER